MLKDQILNADDRKLEPMHIEEWNTTIYLPVVTVGESKQLAEMAKQDDSTAQLLGFYIRDEQGNRVFDEEECKQLMNKPLSIINRIVDRFNKLNFADDEAAGKSPQTTD
ncbi:MAG: hypothetical protein AAGG38_07260 [Planctomycetota bacterium]